MAADGNAPGRVHLPVLPVLPVLPRGTNRHHPVRARTESMRRPTRAQLQEITRDAAEYPERPGGDYRRPRTFGECESAGLGAETPCPFVSCKYHLAVDVSRYGSIKHNMPHVEPGELEHSCTLRVAEIGGLTLDDVAAVMNMSRERVRQLEDQILAKIAARLGTEQRRGLLDLLEHCGSVPKGPGVVRARPAERRVIAKKRTA